VQGSVNWRQREVPVIDFERLLGAGDQPPGIRQRIAICYAPDPQAHWPLLGLIAQGIPRLLRLGRDAIEEATKGAQGDSAVMLRMRVGGEALTVPDLAFLQAGIS
jgi:chemotaxis signal transduction protein